MVSAEFLDWLDATVRAVRGEPGSHRRGCPCLLHARGGAFSPAFGGIQLIVCGDFSQLPPVPGAPVLCNEAPEVRAPWILLWSYSRIAGPVATPSCRSSVELAPCLTARPVRAHRWTPAACFWCSRRLSREAKGCGRTARCASACPPARPSAPRWPSSQHAGATPTLRRCASHASSANVRRRSLRPSSASASATHATPPWRAWSWPAADRRNSRRRQWRPRARTPSSRRCCTARANRWTART